MRCVCQKSFEVVEKPRPYEDQALAEVVDHARPIEVKNCAELVAQKLFTLFQ